MIDEETILLVKTKYDSLSPFFDERTRRYWAASEATAIGWGGVSAVAQATGLSQATIKAGIIGLEMAATSSDTALDKNRTRRAGGGRKRLVETDPGLPRALRKLLASSTRGDPQSPLLWTSKSTRHLAEELSRQGHPVSYRTVDRILHEMEYSLQGNRKTKEGANHPDRDAQFEHISQKVIAFQKRGCPVISVDAKKRELMRL